MTAVAGERDSLPSGSSAHPTVDSVLFTWLVSSASPAKVLMLAAPIVAAAIWALLSPPVVLSREMTWDLLFNLAGAWHLCRKAETLVLHRLDGQPCLVIWPDAIFLEQIAVGQAA